jgi:hypothetical protein
MLVTVTALAMLTMADSPQGKEPPSKDELAAITQRGLDLAGYDAAGWHASDAVQAKNPKPGIVVRYIARNTGKGWMVAFGKLNDKQDKFLIGYEATQGAAPLVFDVKEFTPPKADKGFFLSAAKAIDTALKDFTEHFEGERRPYNVAVLPAEKDQWWVYLVPAPTRVGIWPLGGDVRYLISSDGHNIVAKRQLHKSVIEVEPPKDQNNQQMAGIHTHVLSDTPEDTDVFHVLTRKPTVPEYVSTEHFLFTVEADGSIKFRRAEEGPQPRR